MHPIDITNLNLCENAMVVLGNNVRMFCIHVEEFSGLQQGVVVVEGNYIQVNFSLVKKV